MTSRASGLRGVPGRTSPRQTGERRPRLPRRPVSRRRSLRRRLRSRRRESCRRSRRSRSNPSRRVVATGPRPVPASPTTTRSSRRVPTRPHHRHRSHARRVRDDRARLHARHRDGALAVARRANCAHSPTDFARRGSGGARDHRAAPRLRHRRRHRHRQDARRSSPIAHAILGTDDAARRRDQPRARGDARDADVERGHRHDRHRAALVPGRRHPAAGHAGRRRDPPDVAPSWNSASRSASASAAGSSGCRRRSTRRSTRATSTRPSVVESSAFDPAKAADVKVLRNATPLEFLDDKFLQRVHEGEARRGRVPADARGGGAGWRRLVGARFPRMTVAFYHGGEPIRVIRPFLEGEVPEAVPARR